MAKLLKLRRGTTTQHASFTGAEGELTIDTTKDTAVVHDGSTQSGHTLLREDLSNLPAGTIDNADVNSSAAIAGTKITPNFGSQNVATTGTLAAGATTVSGNIAVSGTVDGVDVAALKTSKDSLSTTNGQIKSSVSLANGVTATTQGQSDNSTKVATTSYVRSAVANVVDSAPATLDTLNELAAALGDDANYATTTANSIGTKLPKSGGQMTGNITMSGSQTVDGRDLSVDGAKLDGIESGATADQTKSDIDGLNINADQVDGLHASSFVRNDSGNQSIAGNLTVGTGNDSYIYMVDNDNGQRQIHNNTNRIGFLKQDGNWGAYCDDSGNWTAEGNVTAYSDARLKTDISTINDALGIVGKLRGVSYKWLRDGTEGIGVIAQEVEAVLPSVVVTNEEPGLDGMEEVKSVDYGKIVGVLINAINELKAEVDELKGGK